jgi:ATP-binding cassette subfamily C protein
MSRAVSVDFGMTLAAFTQIIAEGLVLIGIVTVLLIVSPQVTLLAGGTLLLIAFGFVRLTRRMVLQLGRRSQILAAAVLQGQQQALGAIKEIKVLGRGGFFEAAYRRGEFELMRLRYLDVLFQTLPRILIETLFICGALVVIVSITLGGSPGSHTVSLLGLYAYAGFRIIPSTNRIVWQITALRHGRAAVDIVHSDFFSVYPLGWADEEPPAPSASLEFSALVRFEDVSFQYPETTRPAIDGINLEIRKGESVGIVGATGSGKSTLVDLLVGLLEPTSGRILIDVTELRGRERSWQSEIGYVPQAICLVDDTLRHNITLGIDPAEIDPVQLAVAIELAQIERLVESLPNGIDTLVGERGVRLSGGERQRIGIARALYHQPAVVVFDEATSALDNRTEADLVKAIDELRGTKTLVLIAHRLSSVRNCDRIVFLSDGCVAAMGTFDELLAKSAEFRAMAVVPEIEKKSA